MFQKNKLVFLISFISANFFSTAFGLSYDYYPPQFIVCKNDVLTCQPINPYLIPQAGIGNTNGIFYLQKNAFASDAMLSFYYKNPVTQVYITLSKAYSQIKPDINAPGNKWEVYQGNQGVYQCASATPQECPFTNTPYLGNKK